MTRLITAAPALVTAAAACLIAAATAAHRVRRRRTPQPTSGPRAVVEAALWDWWLTTDLRADYDPAEIAVQIDEYLRSSGFTIAADIRKHRMPTLSSIVGAALIAAVAATSTAFAAARGEWWWALIGALATALLTREVCRDLADRRHHHNAR